MNIQQMRRVDLICGSLFCIVLQLHKTLTSLFKGSSRNVAPGSCEFRRILITKYLGMGSIMMSSPMIQVLRTRYPESRIDLLTFAGNAELAEHLDLFDNIMSLRTSSFWSFVRDFFRVMAVMIRTRYDVVFDLEFFSRFSTIVSYLSGARIRVGYYLPKIWRGRFLTHQIHFNPFRHVTEILAAQLEPFGMQVNEYSLKSPRLDVACRARVQSVLADCGWREGTTLVLVNPNASDLCEERKWPRENFVALLEGMCRDHPGFFFALLGSRGERAYVESIHQQLPENVRGRVLCLAGELTIGELIALFSLSRLLITNDSGPLHIAAALNIPTVAFFGPETPQVYGPVGGESIIFYKGIYCSPCLNVYNAKTAMCNGNNRCMKEISLQDVRAKLEASGLLS